MMIKDYFRSFSVLKWVIFFVLFALITATAEQQVTRVYWNWFAPPPMVVIGEIKILNKNKAVRPGGILLWNITIDKKLLIQPVEVTAQLINHVRWTITVDIPPMKPLGLQSLVFPMIIPTAADCGKYTMVRTYTYELGPNKIRVFITAQSEPFYVLSDAKEGRPDPRALIEQFNKVDQTLKESGWTKTIRSATK